MSFRPFPYPVPGRPCVHTVGPEGRRPGRMVPRGCWLVECGSLKRDPVSAAKVSTPVSRSECPSLCRAATASTPGPGGALTGGFAAVTATAASRRDSLLAIR